MVWWHHIFLLGIFMPRKTFFFILEQTPQKSKAEWNYNWLETSCSCKDVALYHHWQLSLGWSISTTPPLIGSDRMNKINETNSLSLSFQSRLGSNGWYSVLPVYLFYVVLSIMTQPIWSNYIFQKILLSCSSISLFWCWIHLCRLKYSAWNCYEDMMMSMQTMLCTCSLASEEYSMLSLLMWRGSTTNRTLSDKKLSNLSKYPQILWNLIILKDSIRSMV